MMRRHLPLTWYVLSLGVLIAGANADQLSHYAQLEVSSLAVLKGIVLMPNTSDASLQHLVDGVDVLAVPLAQP